ncbi:conserved hypothetical protein [Culex quinquefasciatus]|uniref:Uncharacterized protein n=1 Tax=Culex quinquefasciatus TaxID=7176 RepID=B0WP27_CULQU|nr:conserved hypothetical protein [Culex quinquefasciatus]|eukprot:XP_001850461.1 conserved hypothetical protein [Culex quinquefasciatus]
MFRIQLSFAYTADALDYILKAVEFLESIHAGVFSCVFWDISAHHTYDNIQQAVLESSRLTNVVRYVVKGCHRTALEIVPWSPTVLFIWPGYDAEYLGLEETRRNIYSSTELIDPSTKVLSFAYTADALDYILKAVEFLESIHAGVFSCVFWDISARHTYDNIQQAVLESSRLTNVVRYVVKGCHRTALEIVPWSPTVLFIWPGYDAEYLGLEETRRNIYSSTELIDPSTKVVIFADLHDLKVAQTIGGLLNNVRFRNNPTLLAICGFERYNLHRAGSLEKILFLSLIVLMFFMSNAFETKIVSLMVRKPSIQRINTLDDLAKSDLKFHFDLDSNPHFANHSVIGKMVAHGSDPWIHDTMPGIAMIWYSDFVELRKELAYDYERMQPFYVLLGYRYFYSNELYWTAERFIFLKPLQLIHIRLVEAGLIDLWKRVWRARVRFWYIGRRRPRMDSDTRMDLTFEDMQLAWISLAAGLIASGVLFAVEVVSSCVKSSFIELQSVY